MLYLGAQTALPPVAVDWKAIDSRAADWPARAPRLEVSRLIEHDESVRKNFAEPFVMKAGSYERCGCGFNYWPETLPFTSRTEDDATSLAVARESRTALAEYALANGVQALYGCWDGDQALPVNAEIILTGEQLNDPNFLLPSRTRMLFRT